MKILALETTETIGTVAALDDDHLLRQISLNPGQRSARSLAPGIQELLREVRWHPHDVALVAVTRGPGSFTGLRVGLATAKAFAYAAGAEVLGIDTLEAIAANAPDDIRQLAVAVDAQRGQVVAGRFTRGPENLFVAAGPAELLDLRQWLETLDPAFHLTGPILRKHKATIPPHLTALPPELWAPQAAQVGRLAAHHYSSGQRDDLWTLAPTYSRPSAAEEKRSQRHPNQ